MPIPCSRRPKNWIPVRLGLLAARRQYLLSPIPFFAAVGQHTDRITLGSVVIPMRYQDPFLLAEAALRVISVRRK